MESDWSKRYGRVSFRSPAVCHLATLISSSVSGPPGQVSPGRPGLCLILSCIHWAPGAWGLEELAPSTDLMKEVGSGKK